MYECKIKTEQDVICIMDQEGNQTYKFLCQPEVLTHLTK